MTQNHTTVKIERWKLVQEWYLLRSIQSYALSSHTRQVLPTPTETSSILSNAVVMQIKRLTSFRSRHTWNTQLLGFLRTDYIPMRCAVIWDVSCCPGEPGGNTWQRPIVTACTCNNRIRACENHISIPLLHLPYVLLIIFHYHQTV